MPRNSSNDSIGTTSQGVVLSNESKKKIRVYKGLLLSIAYASAVGGVGNYCFLFTKNFIKIVQNCLNFPLNLSKIKI